MELSLEIYKRFTTIPWFSHCGNLACGEFAFPVVQVKTAEEATKSALSDLWADARTEAQGDLTGYLAKKHKDAYGGHWNRLAKASREKIQKEIMPGVIYALDKLGAPTLAESVLLDLNRIALYSAYGQRFRGLPDFFAKLLLVYEKGYLPCGWQGDLNTWPNGTIVLF
ncbi:MAG TPA: hypothetical protein VKU02_25180 [Gemmataceae bacterium]|nr:hypothetical protein [Gemmataceae bacterium]